MSYYESKFNIFQEYFNNELKNYSVYGDTRNGWLASIEAINGVQNMSPEVMAISFAYLQVPVTQTRFNKAIELLENDTESDLYDLMITEPDKTLDRINKSIKKRRFNSQDDLEISKYVLGSNIQDDIIADIIKKTHKGRSNDRFIDWPFRDNYITRLKLKIEISAYIYNILDTYAK